jgi:hypothetical protein
MNGMVAASFNKFNTASTCVVFIFNADAIVDANSNIQFLI